jgi:cobalt-zinc-cadmium efflux system outer membrane protein
MKSVYTILTAVLIAVFAPEIGSTSTGDTVTLELAIQAAMANNGSYQSAIQMAQSARAKSQSVGAWDDPMLMLGVSNVPTNFDFRMDPMTMTMFGISQSLPLAGQKGLSAKAERRSAEAAEAMARMSALDIQVEVRLAYHDLYFKKQILAEYRKQRTLQSEMVQTATDRFKIGLGNQADVTSAQAAAFRFESQIRSAEQEVAEAANRLSALTGMPILDALEIVEPPPDSIPASDLVWISRATDSYVELNRLESQSEAYALSARAENRMRWPMLTLSASYGVRRDGPDAMGVVGPRDNMVSFGANLSLPLFSGKRNGNMARSMEFMSRAADAEKAQTVRDITARIKSLHSRAKNLEASIESYTSDVIPASEQSYQGALASYRNNQMNLGNLLSYGVQTVGDKITLLQLELELAKTLNEVSRYIVDPDQLAGNIRQ